MNESAVPAEGTQDPPDTLAGTLRHLGPGLIIAGSIVGSGELIGTTKTGAQAGFSLLWLILIGCVIKVFVQIELGRYTISSGDACLEGLNRVPGPRLGLNWILWYWVIMMVVSLGQLGGIVGGVGQSLAMVFPLKGDYASALRDNLAGQYTIDDKYWAAIITALTVVMLVSGRYNLIQHFSTFLVAAFTFLTLGNVVSLQATEQFRFTWAEFAEGLRFRLPDHPQALTTALATFGIIGVGANELIAYPYWCLEKGYARYAGAPSTAASWSTRARGWMRVMLCDAWLSMIVYTVATVAFYILGAAVLKRLGTDPEGMRMISVVAEAYVPVFGAYAKWLFLFGAFAVLYSTFFVANAGHARIVTDAFRIAGLISPQNVAAQQLSVRLLCAAFPIVSLLFFLTGKDPVALVLASGVMQSIMLPILSGAALYLRFARGDRRLNPGMLWNGFLWLSCVGMLISGAYTAYTKIAPYLP